MTLFSCPLSPAGIIFAYAYSMVAVEIQDTLKSAASDGKHGPISTMKRAVNTSAGIMVFFYLLVGCAGYAAFGNSIKGNILEEFDGPTWVLDMANVMVLLHLIPAYQVYSQPFLCFMESGIKGSAKAPAWAKVCGRQSERGRARRHIPPMVKNQI